MSIDYIPPAIVEKESFVVLKKTRWVPHSLAAFNWEGDTFPCIQVYVFFDQSGKELFIIPTGAEKRMTKKEYEGQV